MAKITIVKCDRCGRESNIGFISTDPIDPNLRVSATLPGSHICIPKTIDLDLCDSCRKELKTFLGWPLKLDI